MPVMVKEGLTRLVKTRRLLPLFKYHDEVHHVAASQPAAKPMSQVFGSGPGAGHVVFIAGAVREPRVGRVGRRMHTERRTAAGRVAETRRSALGGARVIAGRHSESDDAAQELENEELWCDRLAPTVRFQALPAARTLFSI